MIFINDMIKNNASFETCLSDRIFLWFDSLFLHLHRGLVIGKGGSCLVLSWI